MSEDKSIFEFLNQEKVKEILSRYPKDKKQSAINPLLHLVQQENKGWIPKLCVSKIVELTGCSKRVVFENLYFYKMYNTKVVRGKYHVIVCTAICCGNDLLLKALEEFLKIKVGETTRDKLFSLFETGECLGSCVDAPVMIIANFSGEESSYNYYMGVKPKNAIGVLGYLKSGGTPKETNFRKFVRTTLIK